MTAWITMRLTMLGMRELPNAGTELMTTSQRTVTTKAVDSQNEELRSDVVAAARCARQERPPANSFS